MLLAGTAGAQQPAGSRSFGRAIALEDSGATSASVSVGDLNRDGHLDLVLVRGRHWPLSDLVFLSNGKGAFHPAVPLAGPPDRSYSGALADLDGDGDLDIVVSNDTPDAKLVHFNDGTGKFTPGPTFGRSEWPTRYLSVADLNADSLPDVVLANRYGNQGGPSYVCFGRGRGTFADRTVVSQGSATTIRPADVNGDKALDLVVPHRDAGQSYVYINDGKGGFGERRPFGPASASIRSAEPADLNGDGILDLAVIEERPGGTAILWGRSDGTWTAAEPLGTGRATPYALSVADVDRNGRLDVVVGHVESRPVVYFNDADLGFHPEPFGDNLGTTYGFAVSDIDGDGYQDIALARSGSRSMLYFGSPLRSPAAPPADALSSLPFGTPLRWVHNFGERTRGQLVRVRGDSLATICFEPCAPDQSLQRSLAFQDLQRLEYRRGSHSKTGFYIGALTGLVVAGAATVTLPSGIGAGGSVLFFGIAGGFLGGLGGFLGRGIGSAQDAWVQIPIPR